MSYGAPFMLMVMASLAAADSEDRPDLRLKSVHEMIVADWDQLKQAGIRYRYEQTHVIFPGEDKGTIPLEEGNEFYYQNASLREHVDVCEKRGRDRIVTFLSDGKYRVLKDRRQWHPLVVEPPEGKPPEIPELEGFIVPDEPQDPEKRIVIVWKHPIDLEHIVSPTGIVPRNVPIPKYRILRAGETDPDYESVASMLRHTLEQRDQVTVITTTFEDPTFKFRDSRMNVTHLMVTRVLELDETCGGLPVRCEFSAMGDRTLSGELSWHQVDSPTGKHWLLTEAKWKMYGHDRPGRVVGSTFRIDPESIQSGPPEPGALELEFPPGTRVTDRTSNERYIVGEQSNATDHLDRTFERLASRMTQEPTDRVHELTNQSTQSSRNSAEIEPDTVDVTARTFRPNMMIAIMASGALMLCSMVYAFALRLRRRRRDIV